MLRVKSFSVAYLNECYKQLLVLLLLLQAGNNITIMFSFQLNSMVMLTFRGGERGVLINHYFCLLPA